MKIIFIIIVISFFSISKSKATFSMNEKIKDTSFTRQDMHKIWSGLFLKTQESQCSETNLKYNLRRLKQGKGRNTRLPTKKKNKWDKQYGFGLAAYLFDYIDSIFQKYFTSHFKLIYEKVKNIELPRDSEYSDPYSMDKIIYRMTKQRLPKSADPNDPALLVKLKELSSLNKSNFNEKSYINSITAPMIYSAVKKYKWNYDSSVPDWAKYLVDQFDFDGDGRLNPREFILMTIINNKNILGTYCKYCYNELLSSLIDPIFFYLDCNNDALISSEDIWNKLADLNRPDFKKFNIYRCVINGKKYRTSSVNDFVLKNMKTFEGYLNRQEFRLGILLGYWDRQMDTEKTFCDDCHNLKFSRWSRGGYEDKVCLRILKNNDHDYGLKKN